VGFNSGFKELICKYISNDRVNSVSIGFCYGKDDQDSNPGSGGEGETGTQNATNYGEHPASSLDLLFMKTKRLKRNCDLSLSSDRRLTLYRRSADCFI